MDRQSEVLHLIQQSLCLSICLVRKRTNGHLELWKFSFSWTSMRKWLHFPPFSQQPNRGLWSDGCRENAGKEKSKRECQVLSGSYSCVLFCETMKDRKHEFLTFSLVLTPLVAEASKEKETNKTIKILKYFSMHRTCNMVVQSSPRQRKTQEKPKEPAFGNGQSPRHKKHVFQFCII